MTEVIQLLAYYLYMGGMIVCSGGLTNSVRNTLVPQAILITTSTLKSEHWASSNMVVFFFAGMLIFDRKLKNR